MLYMTRNCHIWLEHNIFCQFWGLPALCVCVAAACGASATSEKTHPGILEHVSCGCCRLFVDLLSILGSPKWYRHMTPTTTTTRDGPTTATPSSHQQAPRTGTKYPVQETPLTLIICLRKIWHPACRGGPPINRASSGAISSS